MNYLLSTAYLPPSLWFAHWIQEPDSCCLEKHENSIKQSFRNRCRILSAQGMLDLSIPLLHSSSRKMDEIEISYAEEWRKNHWRAIQSAYSKAPFFAILAAEMEELFLQTQVQKLWDWNEMWIHWVFKWLDVTPSLSYSNDFELNPSNTLDLRNSIHPKKELPVSIESAIQLTPLIQQMGSLSVLHLLCYEGPNAFSELAGK